MQFSARGIIWGGAMLGLAVALGAFGAHGLQSMVSEKQIETWHKAVDYLVIHGFAVMIVAILAFIAPIYERHWRNTARFFVLGALLFSGSLFAWVLTSVKWLVFLTPIGGSVFLIGWVWLIWTASVWLKAQKTENNSIVERSEPH